MASFPSGRLARAFLLSHGRGIAHEDAPCSTPTRRALSTTPSSGCPGDGPHRGELRPCGFSGSQRALAGAGRAGRWAQPRTVCAADDAAIARRSGRDGLRRDRLRGDSFRGDDYRGRSSFAHVGCQWDLGVQEHVRCRPWATGLLFTAGARRVRRSQAASPVGSLWRKGRDADRGGRGRNELQELSDGLLLPRERHGLYVQLARACCGLRRLASAIAGLAQEPGSRSWSPGPQRAVVRAPSHPTGPSRESPRSRRFSGATFET
jgi:hypothetical protein